MNAIEQKTMSSLEISELTDKRHDNVMRDIRKMITALEVAKLANSELSWHCESASYVDSQGKVRELYNLDKDTTITLLSGYDIVARHKIVKRWQHLEASVLVAPVMPELTRKDLAMMVLKAEEEKEAMQQQLAVQAPKVEYVDALLSTPDCVVTTVIATELGYSAVTFNRLLKQKGVQWKVDGMWVLTSRYLNKGYTQMRTHTYNTNDGQLHSTQQMVWTQRGRALLWWLIKGGTPPLALSTGA